VLLHSSLILLWDNIWDKSRRTIFLLAKWTNPNDWWLQMWNFQNDEEATSVRLIIVTPCNNVSYSGCVRWGSEPRVTAELAGFSSCRSWWFVENVLHSFHDSRVHEFSLYIRSFDAVIRIRANWGLYVGVFAISMRFQLPNTPVPLRVPRHFLFFKAAGETLP